MFTFRFPWFKLNEEYKVQKLFEPTAFETKHDWPGNVRELFNTISRGFAVSRSNHITAFDLSTQNRRITRVDPAKTEIFESIEENERCHLARVLTHTGWHKTKTIRILGITYPRLQRLITKYGLTPG